MLICANKACRKPFVRPKKSKRMCCSRSCGVAWSWTNPKTAQHRRATISASKKTPEAMAVLAAHNQRRWSDPKARERLSEWNRERWRDPETRQQLSAAIRSVQPYVRHKHVEAAHRRWADPEIRARTIKAAQTSQGLQAYRAQFSQMLRARWQDPVWREKYISGMRRKFRTREMREMFSAISKARWADPAFREKMKRANEASARSLRALWADPAFHDAMVEKLTQARKRAAAARRNALGIIRAEDAADAMTAVILTETGRRLER